MNKQTIVVVIIAVLCSPWQLPANAQTQATEELEALYSQYSQLYDQGKYAEAIPIAEIMLPLVEKIYGPIHKNTAGVMNNLALLYVLCNETNHYAKAEHLSKKSLEIYKAVLGEDHPYFAAALNTLAMLYDQTNRYAEAEFLYERSLTIQKAKLGEYHPDVADSINNLAGFYRNTGQYNEAERLYKNAIEIMATTRGENCMEVARSLSGLALIYNKTGRYVEAEPLFKRSLEIKKAELGNDHPAVANSLNSLAAFYRDTGRYEEAVPLNIRSLEIRKTKLGEDHPDVAESLNVMALIYHDTGHYAEAELLYKRTLEILNTTLKSDHPDVASALNNLAGLYKATGRYAEAEPLYKKALEISKTTRGSDSHHFAIELNNLAELYRLSGRYAEAESLYKKALEIDVVTLGKDHPDTTKFLTNLALLYAATEKYDLSYQHHYKSITLQDKERENVFLLLNERQKLASMEKNRGAISGFLTLTSQHLQKDSNAIQDTLNAWLRWKGAVTEMQGRITEACSSTKDPTVVKKCEELNNVRRTLASLTQSKPEKINYERYRTTLAEYEGKKNTLEAELSKLSKDFSLEKQVGKADIPTIASILPKGSAYLDFAVIQPYDFKKQRFEEKPRYLAFVLIPDDPPRVALEDLGDAEAIDEHIRAYHKVIQDALKREPPRTPSMATLKEHLKALHGLVLGRLLPHIKDRKQLFVSPDGGLNLIPFEAFITPGGNNLLEDDFSIHYVAAGRDIVRFKDDAKPRGEALILADPDYRLGESELIEMAKSLGLKVQEVSGVLSQDDRAMSFARLEGAGQQAEEIRKLMGGVIYPDKKAIQEVLFAARSPRVLHIATHGYFLPVKKIAPQWGPGRDTLPPDALKAYENPMLRSGIALAGANTSMRGRVTAEKVLGLRLKGTELVVLSACQTGVGDIQTGEGVFGLKRAFILSGAKTVVMSLWSVPAEETTQLMESFYTKWAKEKKTKAEALREAKRELMKKKPNPFFWGAFVMVGDPGM